MRQGLSLTLALADWLACTGIPAAHGRDPLFMWIPVLAQQALYQLSSPGRNN